MKRNKEIQITSITLLYVNNVSRRKIKVKLNTGSTIYISPCYESFIQSNGSFEEFNVTVPIAEKFNDWLHGRED